MIDEDEEQYRNNNICRFCEKTFEYDEVRDQLTGKNQGPSNSKCNTNVTQKQSNSIPFAFHNFSIYDCHLFFENLVDKRNDEKKI